MDLNAPYEERTLAFCLLDPNADEQWVRVNRTWLGEGNNLEFAQVADSSEYAPGEVSVTVEAFAANDPAFASPLATYTANDTLLQTRTPTASSSEPEYRAYHFATPDGLEIAPNNNPDALRLPAHGGLR